MQCPYPMEEKREEKIFHRHDEPVVVSYLIIHVCPYFGQESMSISSTRIVEDILNGKMEPSGKFKG